MIVLEVQHGNPKDTFRSAPQLRLTCACTGDTRFVEVSGTRISEWKPNAAHKVLIWASSISGDLEVLYLADSYRSERILYETTKAPP